MKNIYYRLRNGLDFAKAPSVWGAFPLDPYLQGDQQPGMTDQVKEEILTRRLELGVVVANGEIHFETELLRNSEFLEKETPFTYYDLNKEFVTITLHKDSLAYTLCQILVIYQLSNSDNVVCSTIDGDVTFASTFIDKSTSKKIFQRDGIVKKITVNITR